MTMEPAIWLMSKEKKQLPLLKRSQYRLKSLTGLRKYIKNKEVQIETTFADTIMEDTPKKERKKERKSS